MLLPDARADVLSLVKSLDNIIDATEAITKDFLIQKPCFPEPYHKDLLHLTTNSLNQLTTYYLQHVLFLAKHTLYLPILITSTFMSMKQIY